MRVKFILPAMTPARSGRLRPIKYALFPPLGLGTLAGYLRDGDEIELVNEHVKRLRTDDEPELVAMTVYPPSARRAYALADVYVMPSVSEPFGLTALEAVRHGVPVVVSRSSGVAEVLHRGALKVDFWDVDEMANKIVSLLRRPEMADTLRRCAWEELSGLTWDRSARGCLAVYREQVAAGGG